MTRFVLLCLVFWLSLTVPYPATAKTDFDARVEFDAFWSLFDRHYALFETKGVDWDLVGQIYRPQVTPSTTRAELFEIFEAAVEHLNDVHVTVRDQREGKFARSGGRSLGIGPFDAGEFDFALIAGTYVTGDVVQGGGGTMRWGRIDEVGYVHIRSFRYPQTSAAAMDEALQAFSGTSAIIIDVRQNGGGSDAVARALASRFADQERLVMTSERRVVGGGFEVAQNWFVAPVGQVKIEKPVIVLVNESTISAAENFAIMMREFPHVTIVGETTAGAMADTLTHELDSGWEFGIPMNVLRDANGRSWEGTGVIPDYWQSNTAQQVSQGFDRTLEFAIMLAKRRSANP